MATNVFGARITIGSVGYALRELWVRIPFVGTPLYVFVWIAAQAVERANVSAVSSL